MFGKAPEGDQLTDLLAALVRTPRHAGEGGDASLPRALAADLGLGFDPLDCPMAEPWAGPKPAALLDASAQPWRSHGDTVERLELLGRALIQGRQPDPGWSATRQVLSAIETTVRPALERSGDAEIRGVLTALDGRFVEPGPSGAPTRGRLDVLPTGRNFFSVDSRAVPTAAAWHLGWKSAALLVERYLQEHGDWPRAVALSAWGTANMRTGGDDIAQALALIGARPVWDSSSHRVTGIEILPADLLERPRVDVTLRVSGFFRDAFPAQIELFDHAVREVASLDEADEVNPLAARVRHDATALQHKGIGEADALRRASYRVFGSMPGAYGAGLQALIDERGWQDDADLARAYVAWGGYAYGAKAEGVAEHGLFERRLGAVELVLHNQDNREHDILDSDDYYQFEGGLAAAVRTLSGEQPTIYHNDHSRPETPQDRHPEGRDRQDRARARSQPEVARRRDAPRLQGGVRDRRHGGLSVRLRCDRQGGRGPPFRCAVRGLPGDEQVRGFIADVNPAALVEIADRFQEAIDRRLWHPSSNRARELIAAHVSGPIQTQDRP